ncbi:MAG: molybdate ABC transporter substrate-binding protein, partial [Halioglobus sp.]|nr:molybdate ABC transporter substrate-binding protein [Halioglobus sp.]
MRFLTILLLLLACPAGAAQTIRVAVAANFRATLQDIGAGFERASGHRVILSSASTGMLYTQIAHGAPFDLFFAADRETPQKLLGSGAFPDTHSTFCYARGALVLAGAVDGANSLANPARSLAIANPATAPYGVAALQVLERPEFDAGKGRKLVRGSNVVQAYQFWHSGAVDLALVPRALAPDAWQVPPHWYSPIEQHAIALTHSEAVDAYLKWIRSDTVR